jgi:integrase
MTTIRPWGPGKSMVDYIDSTGKRQRTILPDKQAQRLYDLVCADKILEKTESGRRQKNATNNCNIEFKTLALKYRNEHLIKSRAVSNVYYVDILIKKWGLYKIKFIKTPDFRKWIKFAIKNPIAVPVKNNWKLFQLDASSVNKLIRYMSRVFTWNIEDGLEIENPITNVKDTELKKEFKRRKKFKPIILRTDEFWNMVQDWPDYVKNPAIICFFSGLRASELKQLKWSKINRDLHKFSFDADEVKEADSKTVYYDPEVEPILEQCQIQYITDGYTDDLVLRGRVGGVVTKDSFDHSVRIWADKYAEKVDDDKYKQVTPHTFRRSYKSRKDMEGIDRKAVAANMGHHSLSTSEIYNIADEERLSTVAGHTDKISDETTKNIESLIEKGSQEGLTLSQLQSELRKAFLSSKNKPQNQ